MAEEILTYIKSPRNGLVWHFSNKFGLPSNVLKKKRVARILFFKIRPSQEILKIRDGTSLEAEEILTYIKNPRNKSVWHFSRKFDDPSNVVQKKRVARILFFKIRPSQEILKIRDGTPLEKKRVARILFFKIRPSQEILKIRDGTHLEAEEILTYIKSPRNGLVWHFSNKFRLPSNVLKKKRVARILFFKIRPSQEILKIRDGTSLEKKRVARILFFKIRPSQEILKIRDGTHLEAEEILTYIKSPRNGLVWYFSNKFGLPSNVLKKKRVARILFFKIRPSQEILKIRDGTSLEAEEILTYIKKPAKQIVAQILFFKIRPSQEILKIRDGTHLEAKEILTYIKSPRNGLVWHFPNKFGLPSNVLKKKRVARILFFKIRPSQEILKIRDGTPLEKKRVARILFFKIRPSQEILKIRDGTHLEAEEILTYIKSPRNGLVWYFSNKFGLPSNVLKKKRVARILFFKIRPSQEILKIRDGTSLEAEEILTYIKKPAKQIVARILFFKIRPSQEILKIRDGTHLEAKEILTYIKSPRNGLVWHFSNKFGLPSNVLKKKRVARILFFKIRPSQEILKIRDGTPLEKKRVARILFFKIRPSQEILKIRDGTHLEAEEILTYIKSPRNGLVWYFSNKFGLPSNVLKKKRVARILFFKIRPSQEILKIRDGTSLEAEEILTYIKKPAKQIVARILFFKIRPSQEILKIRDGTHLEAKEILTYIKSPRNGLVWHFSNKFGLPSNVLKKKRVARILFFKIRSSQEILKICDVARILFFKIRPSQEILKIRDGTHLEAEEILTYIKSPRNGLVWYFSNKFGLPSNVLKKKRVARILFFKIKPSQEILKIRDGTSLEAEEILTYIKKPAKQIDLWPSQEILKIHDGTHLEKKRVARILFFKIRPSQENLKIRDGTHLEAEEILTYIKSPRNGLVWHFSNKFGLPSNVLKKKRVARILFFKIRPSQEILKIRDGTSLEAEEILTYIKNPRNKSVWHFSRKFDDPSNVVQKKRVARILFFKIRPSQEILKIRDGTPLEAEEILTYIKKHSKQIEILKIHDGTHLEKKRVARILFFKIRPSQEILKIRDGTHLEAEEILTYIKSPRNGLVWHFSNKFRLPSNVLKKKRVARILFFKIRPSQEILKIRDGTSLEILKIHDGTHLEKKRVARILFFKIRPSQEILKIRDGTHLEAEEILTYIKSPRNGLVWYFSNKFGLPSNVLKKKRVARILFFKIRPSQEILKIRDGTSLEAEEILTYIKKPAKQIGLKRVARILFFKIRPSQEILKIRDGTHLEAKEILTYIKSPRNGLVWHFPNKFGLPSNVLKKKRVARILFFKIRPSQEILKIRDGTPLEILKIHDGTHLEKKRVARILFFKIRPSQEILKIRDGTHLEVEEILTYIKSPRNGLVWYFSNKFGLPSNVLKKKRVARILFFKIRPSQEILKIRDGTSLEAEEILTYIKKPAKQIGLWPSQEILKIHDVARILFFKIRPSQEILKIRDGTHLEAKEILTYIKSPRNGLVWHFSNKFGLPSNVLKKKRVARILFFKIRPSQEILKICDEILKIHDVARILFFKIRPSQEILKIRDGTHLEAEEILTYIKSPRNGLVWYFSNKFGLPSNVLKKKRVARILFSKIKPSQEILKIRDGTSLEAEEILTYIKKPAKQIGLKKRVARILFFKIRPSQENLKIRDGTHLEAEEILTYIKSPRNGLVWHFSNKFGLPSNVLKKKRVARILFFKIRPSQEILKIRDGTSLEAEEILTYIKNPRNKSVWHFSRKFDDPSNVVQKKRVARILFFKIRPSQEILKIRDGTPLEAEEILTYIKKHSKQIDNVLQKKRVARILFFKIRPSQEILKIRDGTHLEAEEILTYIKSPRNGLVWHFSNKFRLPSNVLKKKRVARILFFKIRPSQEILKIRDGTSLEAEEILTYIKNPRNKSVWHFSRKFDDPSNVVQKKRVARILFFKIRPSQEILKIRDGTPLEFDVPSNVVRKKRVTRILFFKIRPSQEILKIRDGTPLEAEEILTYIKCPRNGLVWHFSNKFGLPSNVLKKKRVARILFFKIRPSQEILKIHDGTHLEAEEILTYIKSPRNGLVWHFSNKFGLPSNVLKKKRVARILFFKIRPSQEILKIRDGTSLEAEEILTYIKNPRNKSVWHFSRKFDDPSNVVQKKRVARILFFKIRPSQEILKIRDGTPLEAEEILTYIKKPSKQIDNVLKKKRVARILFFKIRPSQEILKIRDGTHLEAEEILTYIKSPRNGLVWHFSNKFGLPSNVLKKKRVARILFFKIRPSQEILKIRDGTSLEAEEILTYIKNPRNKSVWHFSRKFDDPSNVVQKKRVARILFFKIRPSQEILKIRDGTPLEAEEILTYIKKPSKQIVARILFFKIRPSQEILKIRDGTHLEAEEILTYIKSPRNGLVWHFSNKFGLPSNVLKKKRVARILFFKIRPSQEILKIRDGTSLEAEEILTYIKNPRNKSVWHFSRKFDDPSNVVQKKRVARILFFKIRPSQEILKIRDGTPLEAEEILTYIKKPSKQIVARILFFKIRPSQEILKIRDGTHLEAEEILTYIKSPRNGLVWYFSNKFGLPSNVLKKKRVVRILFFKIRPSQEILKIRDGTPLEAEEILTYIKKPSKQIGLALF
ncbi:hypothetical protein OROGR_030766 [Orobanche gracilis]